MGYTSGLVICKTWFYLLPAARLVNMCCWFIRRRRRLLSLFGHLRPPVRFNFFWKIWNFLKNLKYFEKFEIFLKKSNLFEKFQIFDFFCIFFKYLWNNFDEGHQIQKSTTMVLRFEDLYVPSSSRTTTTLPYDHAASGW